MLSFPISVRIGWIALTSICVVCAWPAQGRGDDELQKLVISPDETSAEVDKVKEAFLVMLSAIAPSKDHAVTITKDGHYLLYGELFGDGKSYALATLNGEQPAVGGDARIGVGFAVWTGGKWEIRGIWRIEPEWAAEDPKKMDEDYHPIRPAKLPFRLMELSGDNVPEVVLVGVVWRYWQEHYVLKLTREGKLQLVADAMGEPARAHGLLRLHFNSGRLAIFEREEFFRWSGDTLVPVATFHTESPYHDPDAPFVRITRYDSTGKGGVRWKIEYGDGEEMSEDKYLLYREPLDARDDGLPMTDGGKQPSPSARVSFVWPFKPDGRDTGAQLESENRYFWERLSGLPWSALPSEPDGSRVAPLQKGVKVTVQGDADLVRRLSTEFHERIAPPSARPMRSGR